MCGIVGFTGKSGAVKSVINGLKTLEYRGYDSAGITYMGPDGQHTHKQVGRVQALEESLGTSTHIKEPAIAIGHTRWATHGAPTINNAHPHFNQAKTISVVHNGIIENYLEIKEGLEKNGYKFISNTDTEAIPHLLDWNYKKSKDFELAFTETIKTLKGAYGIAALCNDTPKTIYAAKLSSPLIIGVSKGSHMLASDPTAVMDKTKKIIYLEDYELAIIKPKTIKIKNFKKSVDVLRKAENLTYDQSSAQLGTYKHYMLKEIYEAPQTIQAATRGRIRLDRSAVKLGGLESVAQELKYIERIIIVACGTSYYAGMVGEYLIEEIAGIPVEVQLASEFKYKKEPYSRSTAVIAISQSGETADTIAALKKLDDFGMLRLGIVNAVGSTIARMTDAGVYCHAGPEQSVASTKAFIAQVTVLSLIALYLSDGQSNLYKPLLTELSTLPDKAKKVLENEKAIQALAKKYANYKNFLYIGRNYGYPSALEGALKLKEVSYIHAEGYAAGEMKHGPLAMIDEHFPTLALATNTNLLDKLHSNLQEIKARGGPVLAIAQKGDKKIKQHADDVIYVPKTMEQLQPIMHAIVLQLFSYHIACIKKLDVDKPRNLAKSVTVE